MTKTHIPWLSQDDATFRLFVESVEDYAIFLLDRQGLIQSWNPGAERIKGYRAPEIIGKHFSQFYTPEDIAVGKCGLALETALKHGRFEDYGWRVRKDGSRFWANVIMTSLRGSTGQTIGFAKVTRNLSDRVYKTFIEATNSIIWNTDSEGLPTIDSPSWRAFTGQSEHDWRNLKEWGPFHPDDKEAIHMRWSNAKKTKTTFEAELRLRRHDGKFIWMAARAIPLLNVDGSVREWFGVTFDISLQKQAEADRRLALDRERQERKKAEQAESRWTTTLRSIGDAVIVTDSEGKISFINPVAEALTGWSARESMGQPLLKILNIELEEPIVSGEGLIARIDRVGGLARPPKHLVLLQRDGHKLSIEDRSSPIRDASGSIYGIVTIFRDITNERDENLKRAKLLEREHNARVQAEVASRTKDEFLATVSHELRTPLNAILGWTKLLLMKDLPNDFRKALTTIERNALAQARIIEDVLDLSRIVSGKLHLDVGLTCVSQAVWDAVEASRPLASKKQIELIARIEPKIQAHADSIRLQQIVTNLVINAIKFTPEGGKVTVEFSRVATRLRLMVQDTGEGIDPGLLSIIFDPFRQADASTTKRHGGLGLGLAIVRQLAHAHGGVVRAESEGKNMGATFIVEFPIHSNTNKMPLSSTAISHSALPNLSGIKILVVDDEPDAVELLRELFISVGGDVEIANNAENALSKLAEFIPQVIVSDIGMPDIDGYGLIRRIRALPPKVGGLIPAIALSAYTRMEDAQTAISAGFQSYLGKPVDPSKLLLIVAELASL